MRLIWHFRLDSQRPDTYGKILRDQIRTGGSVLMARRSLWRRSKAGLMVPGELMVLASPRCPNSLEGTFAVALLPQSFLTQCRCPRRDRPPAGLRGADEARAPLPVLPILHRRLDPFTTTRRRKRQNMNTIAERIDMTIHDGSPAECYASLVFMMISTLTQSTRLDSLTSCQTSTFGLKAAIISASQSARPANG